MAIIKDQKSKHSLNSELNAFVSSLNAAVGRENFCNPLISFKAKLSFKKPELA